MREECDKPECREEAQWMHNPHKDGWIEILPNTVGSHLGVPISNGVCLMIRSMCYGNKVIGEALICMDASALGPRNCPKVTRWWDFWT